MKRIIIKINNDGSTEPFSNLVKLFKKYPELEEKRDLINYYLSRKKKDYVANNFILRRQIIN